MAIKSYDEYCLIEYVLKTVRDARELHPHSTELNYIIENKAFKDSGVDEEQFLSKLGEYGSITVEEKSNEKKELLFNLNEVGFCLANEYQFMLDAFAEKYDLLS